MYQKIKETRAIVLVPKEKKISKELPVFYNPCMKINRDITVALLHAIEHNDLQVADILAATGIRSIRLLQELPADKIGRILVNDINPEAVKIIRKNFSENKIKILQSKIKITANDANLALLAEKGFDYIDIDPFGTPNPFLDAAVRRLARDGILAITATDTGALCGSFENACKRKYLAIPLRNELMHETGIRILIRKVQLIGAQFDKALIPVTSYATLHYMRVFFLCKKGKKETDALLKKHEYLLYCKTCIQSIVNKQNYQQCCGKEMLYAGPLYSGALFDKKLMRSIAAFLHGNKMYNQDKELISFIDLLKEESTVESIGYYDIHALIKHHRFDFIPSFSEIIEACKRKGYAASRTHFNVHAIKSTICRKELLGIINELIARSE